MNRLNKLVTKLNRSAETVQNRFAGIANSKLVNSELVAQILLSSQCFPPSMPVLFIVRTKETFLQNLEAGKTC